jgi:hypothetical protein
MTIEEALQELTTATGQLRDLLCDPLKDCTRHDLDRACERYHTAFSILCFLKARSEQWTGSGPFQGNWRASPAPEKE